MPRALAPGQLLSDLFREPEPAFCVKKQMEEQKRVKATKPFWVSIVLPAWGAEWEQARLFVRTPDSTREEHSSRQRISACISSTASWSCQEGGGCPVQAPHSSHLLYHDDFRWLPDSQKSVPSVFADEAQVDSGHCLCARTSFPSHCSQGLWLPCWADWARSTAQQLCSSLDYP